MHAFAEDLEYSQSSYNMGSFLRAHLPLKTFNYLPQCMPFRRTLIFCCFIREWHVMGEYNVYAPVPDSSQCTTACTDSLSDNCGGTGCMALYKIGSYQCTMTGSIFLCLTVSIEAAKLKRRDHVPSRNLNMHYKPL